MAMKVGGYYKLDDIMPRHWARTCEEAGYAYSGLKKIIKWQCESVATASRTVADEMKALAPQSRPFSTKMLAYLDRWTEKVSKRFEF